MTKNEIKTPTVEIPAEIISENHRKAYAMAYVAGFTGRKLAFVAPWSATRLCADT
jgi:hypothetical protein